MKLVNGYWTDDKNNRWSESRYTEEQAIAHSKTLVNCTNCTGCLDCLDCTGCLDCLDCTECTDCTDCTNCTNCTDCTECTNCTDCTDFEKNPDRYGFKKHGRGYANTCAYWTGDERTVRVVCGCFYGTLKEFEDAVNDKHGKDHGYHNAIKKIRMLVND